MGIYDLRARRNQSKKVDPRVVDLIWASENEKLEFGIILDPSSKGDIIYSGNERLVQAMTINEIQSGGSTVMGMNRPRAEVAQRSEIVVPVVESGLVPPVSCLQVSATPRAGLWFRVFRLHFLCI